ncbi:hypothetical protein ACTFIW_002255 [Dictyostelium discoideum]
MNIPKIGFEEKLERFMEKIGVEYNEMKIIKNKQIREKQKQYMLRKCSDWFDFKGVSENDCFREIINYFKIQPNYIPNSNYGKKFLCKNKEIISFSELIIIMGYLEKRVFFFIIPMLIIIFLFGMIQFMIYKDNEIIECLSNNVNVRYDLSYYKYKLPRKYTRDKEYLIVLSDGKPVANQVNSDEKLVVAKEDIILDLVKLYGDSNEFQTFTIKKEDGFRRRKIGKNQYMASMVITKEDGKTVLTYTNNSIPKKSFKNYKVETIKVLTKHGVINFFY